MWAAGLGAGARQAFTAEGLHADERADHAAVHIGVADAGGGDYFIDEALDAAVDAEREAEAGVAEPGEHLGKLVAPIGADVQDRSVHLRARQIFKRKLERDRRNEV